MVRSVAVAVLAFLMMGAAQIPSPAVPDRATADQTSAPATPPSFVDKLLDRLHKGTEIAALLVAGVWTYYLFFRGRTFRPRLESTLEASILPIGTVRHLKIKARVKNVGLSSVPIERDASGLRVFTYRPGGIDGAGLEKASPVKWERERTVDIFKDHAWVEPGETIEDNWLLAVSSIVEPAAYKVELKLAGRKTDWYANAVVEALSKPVLPS
jgi:hypothetical protein